jgi:hypothetical protein
MATGESSMKRLLRRAIVAAGAMALPAAAHAQIVVTLPSTSLSTTLTATVSEQARVAVPAGVLFSVGDIGASTAASAASVTIDQIVLATTTKQLRISLQAGAASFTPSIGGSPTWSASDVSWNAATWTQATGSAGTLDASSYNAIATCTAGVSSCSTSQLIFTLAPNTAITNAGNHTLSVTWKIESIGS